MESAKATVIRLELELLQPATRANAKRLGALLCEDFLEVGASGRSFGKEEVLGRLPQEAGVVLEAEDMCAHMLSPEVALVTYSARRSAFGSTATSKRCSVWVQGSTGWRMRYHQGTPDTCNQGGGSAV